MKLFEKAVLFDMDGVILDSESLYTIAEIKLFKEYGVEIPEEDWSLFRGCSEDEFFNKTMAMYKINEDKSTFINKGRQYVRNEFRKNLRFMPGFVSLYKIIIKNYKTGLVTASPKHNLDWIRKIINIDDFFENIISGEETANNKPAPDPYLEMMNRLDIKAYNTVIIEDSLNGINAGLASGAKVIAKTGSVPIEELSIANLIVSDLSEITKDMIDKLLQK